MKQGTYITVAVAAVSLAVVAAVSWHSVQEIHYLKTFFPRSFTVEEAYYASRIELMKVALISLPLVYAVVLAYSFFLMRKR